jgi:hypothetical protein
LAFIDVFAFGQTRSSNNQEGDRFMTPTTAARHVQVLDQFLNPIRDILTPEVAQAIADLRASPATQERIEDLAHRHHEGKLGVEELTEYEALVSGANLVAVLQAKARTVLKGRRTS